MILFFTLIVSYDWSSSNRIFIFAIIKSIMSLWIKNTIWIHRFAFVVVVVIVAIKLSSSFVDCKLFNFISYGYQNVALDKMYYTPSNVGFNAPFFFIIECVCVCMCARLCDTHSHNTVSNSIIIYHDCDDDGVDVDDPRSIYCHLSSIFIMMIIWTEWWLMGIYIITVWYGAWRQWMNEQVT